MENTYKNLARHIYMIFIGCIAIVSLCFATREYNPHHSITNVAYALNTVYQPSTTRDASILIGALINANLTLTTGQSGSVAIQTSPDNVTYTTIATITNNSTGTLVVGLNTTNVQQGSVTFSVPYGGYFKLVSSGTATIAVAALGQQTLY